MSNRYKDIKWDCGGYETPGYIHGVTTDNAQLSVLMDIRDELKQLNALLHCHNFTAIPHTLRSIQKNTTKKRRKVVRK